MKVRIYDPKTKKDCGVISGPGWSVWALLWLGKLSSHSWTWERIR